MCACMYVRVGYKIPLQYSMVRRIGSNAFLAFTIVQKVCDWVHCFSTTVCNVNSLVYLVNGTTPSSDRFRFLFPSAGILTELSCLLKVV